MLIECIMKLGMTYLEDFDLSDETHSGPVVDSTIRQLDSYKPTTGLIVVRSIKSILDG